MAGDLSYIALTGNLGAGFKEASLRRGLERPISFIGSDGGSTDGGPHHLGTGDWLWGQAAYDRDLGLAVEGAGKAGVPLIIGSCGGSGNDTGVFGHAEMVDRLAARVGLKLRVACITTEPDRSFLVEKFKAGKIRALSGAPEIDEHTFDLPGHIVAMAGVEPIQDALDGGADVVLVGRCADAAIYAAMPISAGVDPALAWNAGKIVECGVAAAENRSGQDSMYCAFEGDSFVVEALDPALRCTVRSVGLHTLYETADPYRLTMPSGTLDSEGAVYQAVDDRRVRVTGGTFARAEEYTLKLEGATSVGFLSSFWGSISDPTIIRDIDQWMSTLIPHIHDRLNDAFGAPYKLDVKLYGSRSAERPAVGTDGQIVIVFDLVAESQEAATAMTRAAFHVAFHWPAPEWSGGSITTFAMPYSTPVSDRGEVFRFTLNHVAVLDSPDERNAIFDITYQEVGST